MSVSRGWWNKPGFIHTMEASVSARRTEEDHFTTVKRLLGGFFHEKRKVKVQNRQTYRDKSKEISVCLWLGGKGTGGRKIRSFFCSNKIKW